MVYSRINYFDSSGADRRPGQPSETLTAKGAKNAKRSSNFCDSV
jgi:hypothetical protein